jgi:hypothetical protein
MADEEPGPERKLYKGEVKTLAELGDSRFVVAQVVDRTKVNGKKLPAIVVAEKIDPALKREERRVIFLEPRKGFRRFIENLPATTQLNVLTGRLGREVEDELKTYRKTNLCNDVSRFIGNIGADPEIFVEDETGEAIPSWYFLKPKGAKDTGGNAYYGNSHVYWDGYQGEFDLAAGPCLAYILDGVQAGLKGIYNRAKVFNANARLSARTVVEASEIVRQTAEDKYVEFGCAPSLNVYGMEGRKEHGREVPYRFAGGHLHFGSGRLTTDQVGKVVRALDSILAVSAVSLFAEYDVPVRRQYYGLAGEYRLPSHGLEYRSLSNAWLFHPVTANFIFDFARKIWNFGMAGNQSMWECAEDEWLRAVNDHDVDLARAILTRNRSTWESLLSSLAGPYYGTGPIAFDWVTKGVDSWMRDFTDIERNWYLDNRHGQWLTHTSTPGCNWGSGMGIIRAGGKL